MTRKFLAAVEMKELETRLLLVFGEKGVIVMKKFSGMFRYFGGFEICVFAKTENEARKIALEHFIGWPKKG